MALRKSERGERKTKNIYTTRDLSSRRIKTKIVTCKHCKIATRASLKPSRPYKFT